MRASEFIVEKSFMGSLGKGMADFAKKRGLMTDKEYAQATKGNRSDNADKAAGAITDRIYDVYSTMIEKILKMAKDRRIDIRDGEGQAQMQQILRRKLGEIIVDTLKVDVEDPKYKKQLDNIIGTALTHPLYAAKDPDIKRYFGELVQMSMQSKPDNSKGSKLGSKETVNALAMSDSDEEGIYVQEPSGEFIAYKRGLFGGNFKRKKLKSKDQDYLNWIHKSGKSVVKPTDIIRISDDEINFDKGVGKSE